MAESPEKVSFTLTDTDETTEFYVVGQTKIGDVDYILVTDSMEDGAEAMILKETAAGKGQEESIYEVVEDDVDLDAISRVFAEILDDIDLR